MMIEKQMDTRQNANNPMASRPGPLMTHSSRERALISHFHSLKPAASIHYSLAARST